MSTRKSLLKHFDELIKLGRALLAESPEIFESLEGLAKKQGWQSKCQSILQKTFTKDHVYSKTFAKILGLGNKKAHFTHGVAIMESAREEIEKGFLYKIERLISVDFFDSVIEQAEYMVKSGFKDVAAVLGRVVIENTLKDLAKRENVAVPDKIKLSDLNQLLRKEGVYPKHKWRDIQAKIDLGNYAAHGNFDKYDDSAVQNMLAWIRETLFNI